MKHNKFQLIYWGAQRAGVFSARHRCRRQASGLRVCPAIFSTAGRTKVIPDARARGLWRRYPATRAVPTGRDSYYNGRR